jgi:NAD+ synthase (glutamine-hydrolysing)
MKLALAQLNPTVADITGNLDLLKEAAHIAAEAGAELLVTSELFVCGYPPKDLIERQGFAAHCDEAIAQLAAQLPVSVGLLVGHPTLRDVPHGRVANGCSLLYQGEVQATVHKMLLPNYDVFDERRYFRPAAITRCIKFRGQKLGVHICEDAWFHDPALPYLSEVHPPADPIALLAADGAEVFINLSASPFEAAKDETRQALFARHAQKYQRPFVFVNQFGGNDDLVFDGRSFVLNAQGEVVTQLPGFSRGIAVIDLQQLPDPVFPAGEDRLGDLLDALILGLKDYLRKSGFTDCVLGLSGGVDSALVAYLAARALGPSHVHGLLMPSRYSSDHSVADAIDLAKRLGIEHVTIPIDAIHAAFESTTIVGAELASDPVGLASQNLQSRIRGTIVMERSNHNGWLALATGNKSELAMGYCTLYGDMNGGFAALSDVYKQDVFALCRYINTVREGAEVIPTRVIDKPPSAELAPDQFDQDTLPPYEVLDGILAGLIDRQESVSSLSERFPKATVEWVAKRLDRNEYKRWQMPPGVKLSPRAFGTGRRMPMAAKFEYR